MCIRDRGADRENGEKGLDLSGGTVSVCGRFHRMWRVSVDLGEKRKKYTDCDREG